MLAHSSIMAQLGEEKRGPMPAVCRLKAQEAKFDCHHGMILFYALGNTLSHDTPLRS